ncbi:peptidoglycan editing factor PgeF [Bacillus alveayuensis]|jgi:polyphenol oxidase|uniref:peptidoglycan editing factor PgeF n=1 Tax=Aeribacillus alveayuensis TaxID=279215 RepID=UPI0005D1038C|nr:peptidoglycan editing factor PgeF [Bacillus alveayuensis]
MLEIFRMTSNNEEILFLDDWRFIMPQLVVGFTTKKGGYSKREFTSLNLGLHVDDDADDVRLNRQRLAEILEFPLEKWVCSEQIHDNRIEKVTKNDSSKGVLRYDTAIAGTDGLYTKEANMLLALCFADCVPLYFFAPKHKLVGLAHAGWKGSVKNIAGEMVHLWVEKEKVRHADIYAAIGPSIDKCCYIVDDRVIDLVKNVAGDSVHHLYQETSKGQYTLDLKELNRQLLLQAGIPEQNIIVSEYCTSCADELFFSYRRDRGKTGRMMSFIGRKEEG